MEPNAEQPAMGPGDLGTLFGCLKGALSEDHSIQRQAEEALQQLEPRNGFCSCLAEVITSKEADQSPRWLAAVQLKNSIIKHWRPQSGGNNITDGEKQYIRGKMLDMLAQDNNKIAVQVALVFAKIARVDYPRAWSTLFSDLLAKLQSQNSLLIRRVYLVLHHVLKELASKRLPMDQRNFAEVTKQLFQHIWGQWCSDTQSIISGLPEALQGGQPAPGLLLTIERWLMLLKALRRMLLFGFPSDARTLQQVPVVPGVVQGLLEALQALLSLRAALRQPAARTQAAIMLERGLIKMAKTLVSTQETHPWSFFHSGVFVGVHELFVGQLAGGQQEGGALWERFNIQCMLFINNVLKCAPYRATSGSFEMSSAARSEGIDGVARALGANGKSTKPVVDTIKDMSQQVQQQLGAFWMEGRLQQLAITLMQRFFPLTDEEMEEWMVAPEEFHQHSDSQAYADNVRPCAEMLFAALLEAYRSQLAPTVVQHLQDVSAACPPGAAGSLPPPHGAPAGGDSGERLVVPDAARAKEAVYAAMGTGAYELHDYMDFTPWFRTTLLQEMADSSPAAAPLRRRAALLVGQWAVKLRAEDRPAAYRALLSLLGDKDVVIKLAATTSLHALIEDWEFQEDAFLPFVGPAFQALTGFLQSAEEFNTQIQIFNLINLIIERLADGVKPHCEGLLRLLPNLWQQGQTLLRVQVLVALQRLVNALGTDAPAAYPLLLPILQLCTDINQPDELNLLEDGLQLWLIALRNAPSPHGPLLALYSNLTPIMQRSTEHVQLGCQITASCTLLGQAEFLQHYGAAAAHNLQGLVGAVKERGMLLVVQTLEVILQCCPKEAAALLETALAKLLASILGNQEPGLVQANAMAVYGRILLQAPAAIMQVCSAAAATPGLQGQLNPQQGQDHTSQVLLALLDRWLDKFDSVSSAGARRLSALALCVALTIPLPAVLDRLDVIAACLTAVAAEAASQPDMGAFAEAGYASILESDGDASPAIVASGEASGEANRRRLLCETDPVNSVRLAAFLKQHVEQSARVHGSAFQEAWGRLDPRLAAQLQNDMNR